LVSSLFFLYRSGHLRDLHSFPTRRSSDLASAVGGDFSAGRTRGFVHGSFPFPCVASPGRFDVFFPRLAAERLAIGAGRRHHHGRSEEHTSELQSRENLVCRLLLEKKKMNR